MQVFKCPDCNKVILPVGYFSGARGTFVMKINRDGDIPELVDDDTTANFKEFDDIVYTCPECNRVINWSDMSNDDNWVDTAEENGAQVE